MTNLSLLDVPFELVACESPMFVCTTPAGFPSPAQDDMEEPIDLAAWLIDHPAASYVMRVLAAVDEFASEVEIYSIDESFLDLTPFSNRDLIDHANGMRDQVRRWTTIPTCVGIGPTLAKLATAAAKKNPLFDGVANLRDEAIRRFVLDRFPVGDVWGVGRATATKLAHLGVTTAGQLRDMQMKQARGLGTVVLERLVAELQGVAASVVEVVEPQRRGMAVTRSFGTPVTDLETLMGAVAQYAMRAGEKLRSHGLVAGQLTVFFHTNTHKRDRPQHHGTRRVSLQPMTDDSLELLAAARRGVEAAWRDGFAYTRAGIMLDDLVAADLRPRTLFEGDVDRRARLMTALDEVNVRFGRFHRGARRARVQEGVADAGRREVAGVDDPDQ